MMTRIFLAFAFIILTTTFLIGQSNAKIVSALSRPGLNKGDFNQTQNEDALANCRYGAIPLIDQFEEQVQVIPRLGAGWYLTLNPFKPDPEPANEADFAYMIKVRQNKDEFAYLPGYTFSPPLESYLEYVIQNNPGELWIIGNEVDRGPNPGEKDPEKRGQGDTFPEVYAEAYHEAYEFIKGHDPSAQVAISGLVEVTPGRLQYLDKVWNTYLSEFGKPMPVDLWTMHLYILPEVRPDGITPNGIANVALGTDPTLGKRSSGGDAMACSNPDVYCYAEHDNLNIFAEQVLAMRQWMKQHGQKEKPLLLTEYSILYPYENDGDTCYLQDEIGECFTPERVSNFLTSTLNYLNSATDPNLGYSMDNNRLVQQSMWFSIYHINEGSSSNLVDDDIVTFTLMGETFKDHIFNEEPYQNLRVDKTEPIIATIGEDGKADVNIPASFRNNGNTKINQPFKISFYKDSALSKPIGSVLMSSDILGCAGRPYVTSIEWTGLGEGLHNYWYLIDSDDEVAEKYPGNDDNIGSGKVVVFLNKNFMPVVRSN